MLECDYQLLHKYKDDTTMRPTSNSRQWSNDNRTNESPAVSRSVGSSYSQGGKMHKKKGVQISKEDDRIPGQRLGHLGEWNVVCSNNQHTKDTPA